MLILLILVLGGGTFVAYTLNLLGPMMQMANAATNQGFEIGKAKLRDFLENNETARAAIGAKGRGSSRTNTGISMDTLDSRGKKKMAFDGADDDLSD
ncbi:hypothetical protein V8F06_003733 [Rhypophila decipiens]